MKTELKRWASVGLGTAFLGTGLAACGSQEETAATPTDKADTEIVAAEAAQVDTEVQEATSSGEMGEMGEGEGGEAGEGGHGGHTLDTLPLPKRLAFMTGHVEAGLSLYRAGEPQMAAPHLLHPVSETHEAERGGLDALGFDGSLFEAVSQALEEGRPAEDIEPQLAAAEENLAMVAQKAGGDPVDVIRYLMDVIVVEYKIAITDGAVSDAGEYQDAYGFAIVARDRAQSIAADAPELLNEIDTLINFWPASPIPPENPTPVGQIIAQTSKVAFALPAQ